MRCSFRWLTPRYAAASGLVRFAPWRILSAALPRPEAFERLGLGRDHLRFQLGNTAFHRPQLAVEPPELLFRPNAHADFLTSLSAAPLFELPTLAGDSASTGCHLVSLPTELPAVLLGKALHVAGFAVELPEPLDDTQRAHGQVALPAGQPPASPPEPQRTRNEPLRPRRTPRAARSSSRPFSGQLTISARG